MPDCGLGLVKHPLMGLERLIEERGLGVYEGLELGTRHLELCRGRVKIAARTPKRPPNPL